MDSGKLIIFSAPSGAGKTTIVRHLLAKFPNLSFSISATTRPIRGSEVNGHDYYFISKEEFLHKVAKHEFAEFEEVYAGTYYGTLGKEIQRIWSEGKQVIFDLDVQGGLRLKKKFGANALAVFVMPPSIEVLAERLSDRATDSLIKIEERIAKAKIELSFANNFDIILPNNDLSIACAEAEKMVTDFLNKKN
ncbi:MAG: guanylate kinase [Sphingobacteriaceae bacterium]|jgi:guanylate kinase